MKYIDMEEIDRLPGRRLSDRETFRFRCHDGLGCFNRCCRNLNLFLYPYDVLRLKNARGLSSDAFLDSHVDLVLRPGNHFPDVLLHMAENEAQTCPFLAKGGCTVYSDRPDACRTFPVEQGRVFDAASRRARTIHFFRPPEFCLGQHEDQAWTPATWAKDQGAETYHDMTSRWAELRGLFHQDPWGKEGPEGPRAKMAFMATYNIDRFREFVFESSFLKRYRVKPKRLQSMRRSETELLKIGFEWVRLFIWGIPSKNIRPR
jgi:uncharacterized protein